MDTRTSEKAAAAQRSVEFVEDGMVVGLGTGSTAKFAVEFLGDRIRQGLKIRGIPTSKSTLELARAAGIPLVTFAELEREAKARGKNAPANARGAVQGSINGMDESGLRNLAPIDVTIDGADEIGPNLELIKGGGGALLHEKIVAACSKTVIIIADEHKVVQQLGAFPLPVEVIPFAASPVKGRLEELKVSPVLRQSKDGQPFVTDEGNYIFDCETGEITDPPVLARSIRSIIGVVEHGLFLDMATMVVIGGSSGVQILNRKEPA